MIRFSIFVAALWLIQPAVAANEQLDGAISILNPKDHSKDSLIVNFSAADGKKKLVWKPVARGVDKGSHLVWYEAYIIPSHSAFLLLKHVLGYEDDEILPSIRYVSGKVVDLETKGISVNNGVQVYLSKDKRHLHFDDASAASEAEDFWDKEFYELASGKRVDKDSIKELKPYIPIKAAN